MNQGTFHRCRLGSPAWSSAPSGFSTTSTQRFQAWQGGCRSRPSCMRAQRGLHADLAHVLLVSLDATGTSPEHTTCPVRRSSSGLPLRHVGRLADALQVPSDARRLGYEREQLHPSPRLVDANRGRRLQRRPLRPRDATRPPSGTSKDRFIGRLRSGRRRGDWGGRFLERIAGRSTRLPSRVVRTSE